MVKVIGHIIFIALFLLITFFGIGPVLMADGARIERITTFIIVLLIYGIWIFLYKYFIRKMKDK